MAGYTCPFCGQIMTTYDATTRSFYMNFMGRCDTEESRQGKEYLPTVKIDFFRCPNDVCGKTSIRINRIENGEVKASMAFYPRVNMVKIPDYVPEAIREDYKEACLIQNDSPKAAATLCRRCLQSMIRDFYGIKNKKNLFEEIDALKDMIRPDEWSTLDAIREIGNIGAHMEKDVDLIIDIDPGEAQLLIDTIVQLIDAWYITRHKTEERRAAIAATSERIKAEKNGRKTPGSAPSPTALQPKDT